jgi:hypothetical protein
MVNITGSKFYVCDDKIILCTNYTEPVFGFEPTVAILGIIEAPRMQSKDSVIAAYLAFLSEVFWIEDTIPSQKLSYNRHVWVDPVYKRLIPVLSDNKGNGWRPVGLVVCANKLRYGTGNFTNFEFQVSTDFPKS